MSELSHAILTFVEVIYRETGEDPRRLVLPARAFAMMHAEMAQATSEADPLPADAVPISGVDARGRIWFACTELVPDTPSGLAACARGLDSGGKPEEP